MTLNMKNYKGYDKNPYCSAHYPQTKATVVADTPELQRLARNTELQSQVKYHEEFEKKIKGSKIQISDDPETQRIKHVNSVVSQVEYKAVREKSGSVDSRRQSLPPTSEKKERWSSVRSTSQVDDPHSPHSDRSGSTSVIYTLDEKVEAPPPKRIGSIADYDPVNENYGSLAKGYNPVSRMSQSQEWEETVPVSPSMNISKWNSVKDRSLEVEAEPQKLTSNDNRKDSEDDNREPDSEDVFHDEAESKVTGIKKQDEPAVDNRVKEDAEEIEEKVENPEAKEGEEIMVSKGKPLDGTYTALYDYEAQDEDEIGFLEGDRFIDCESLDAGWMVGTVARTGVRGMLPANYVERENV